MDKFSRYARIAEVEFGVIVVSTQNLEVKLRTYLSDKSFIDFFYTTRAKNNKFSIHWERQHVDKKIFRLDNTPDKKWRKVKTFPLHFHNGKYEKVTFPPKEFSHCKNKEDFFRAFLQFAKKHLSRKF